jgi:hypothetical protein
LQVFFRLEVPVAPLTPGIGLVDAPHFQGARSWSERLRLNSGVEIAGDRIWPRDDWRPPSPDELALLTDRPATENLGFFHIPDRLRAEWWQVAADCGGPAFQEFAGEVLTYLQFKRLPLPPTCTFEVVIHAPGQASTRPLAGSLTAPVDSGI